MSTLESDARPVASVLIPVYNSVKYLKQAVDSVLSQTFADFEALLLDDGSTDGSAAFLDRYGETDPRCRVYHWPNRGLITTLNEGIKLARAEFIIRMDGDDVCMPDRFEKQIRYLRDTPDCVAVGSKVLLIDSSDMPITVLGDKPGHDEIDSAYMTGHAAFFHPATALRRSAVEKIGGYREEFACAEDIDIFLRLAEVGRLANLPDVLLKYRQHLSSIGYKHGGKQADSALRATVEAYRRRGLDSKEYEAAAQQPSGETQTAAGVYYKWGWWALKGGYPATAKKYAFMALKEQPFDINVWKLCLCALRGR